MAALHALVNSVAALFVAVATQIGRTRKTHKKRRKPTFYLKKKILNLCSHFFKA